MLTSPRYARLTIRASQYRGRDGFLVSGRTYPGSAFLTRIFVRERATAEAIRRSLTEQPREVSQPKVSELILSEVNR